MNFLNKFAKKALSAILLSLLLLSITRESVCASNVEIIYETPERASADDTVIVTVSASDGITMTTLGLRLEYDSNKLVYNGGRWTDSLQNSNSSMTLVSDVEYGSGRALNISMISNNGYETGGAIIILEFSVKHDYAANPFTLTLREITDGNMRNIENTTSIIYHATNSTPQPPENENASNEPATPENTENSPDTFQTGFSVSGTKLLFLGCLAAVVGIFCSIVKRKLSR